jgi:Protein of unknown function (DUF2927)
MHRRVLSSASLIAGAFMAAAITTTGIASSPAHAENSDISTRRATERTTFSDDEIRDGFLKTAFRAELQFDRRAERIRKFDEPVRVFVVNNGELDRRADIARIIADIRARVNHLDLAITTDRKDANVILMLVRTRDFAQTIRSRYGDHRAEQIQHSLHPQCLSGIAKDQSYRIRRAEVILPVDAGEFRFYDCAYEELLQSLGLINDDSSVPWTMFNDDVQMGFFDVYDQYLVNMLYDPRVRPGMTAGEVEKLLPDILPTIRAWVAPANSANGDESRGGSSISR